jgi:hypothetical protein
MGRSMFSRRSASCSGELFSMRSTVSLPARVSPMIRFTTFSELDRQSLTTIPYFFVKASKTGFRSSVWVE